MLNVTHLLRVVSETHEEEDRSIRLDLPSIPEQVSAAFGTILENL